MLLAKHPHHDQNDYSTFKKFRKFDLGTLSHFGQIRTDGVFVEHRGCSKTINH